MKRMVNSSGQKTAHEPVWLRKLMITFAVLFVFILIVMPLLKVFEEGFAKGVSFYFGAISSEETTEAIKLSLVVALITVFFNTLFGLSAAWLLTRYHIRGRSIVETLIELPFSVSPVVSGLVFVLLFGVNGWFGLWLSNHHFRIIFALPGIILSTIFITLPFVAKELIPLMDEQGKDQEEAAMLLGASGWQIFFKVTLPGIKWGLFHGVVLCTARALGEFGAVSVVSGHIRGRTVTLPLHVEILYNEYDFSAAFAVASLLSLTAVATVIIKSGIQYIHNKTDRVQ